MAESLQLSAPSGLASCGHFSQDRGPYGSPHLMTGSVGVRPSRLSSRSLQRAILARSTTQGYLRLWSGPSPHISPSPSVHSCYSSLTLFSRAARNKHPHVKLHLSELNLAETLWNILQQALLCLHEYTRFICAFVVFVECVFIGCLALCSAPRYCGKQDRKGPLVTWNLNYFYSEDRF